MLKLYSEDKKWGLLCWDSGTQVQLLLSQRWATFQPIVLTMGVCHDTFYWELWIRHHHCSYFCIWVINISEFIKYIYTQVFHVFVYLETHKPISVSSCVCQSICYQPSCSYQLCCIFWNLAMLNKVCIMAAQQNLQLWNNTVFMEKPPMSHLQGAEIPNQYGYIGASP